jgi:hypothetical protein
MNEDSYLVTREELDEPSLPNIQQDNHDLVILRYMAQRIYVTLYLLDEPVNPARPLLYYSEEGHTHTHRIAIFRPQELQVMSQVHFVGFISGKLKPGSPQVIDEIHSVDKKLVVELINTPGLLSYSSLELRDGSWCNLVLLSDLEAKTHIRNSETHAYAAYQLSPRYYAWIRLHSGIMPGGLAHNEMFLQKTRYYEFHGAHEKPTIRELTRDISMGKA